MEVKLTEKQINHIESAIVFCLHCKIIKFNEDDLIEMQELEAMFNELRKEGKNVRK